ncbi:MAG TPA: phosphopantothenoylcysteine decarboxylase [Gemmataceae bacterium]|nr:phosphopantothenoylcysteine decarboxylase [Gemmataceae bacterium]
MKILVTAGNTQAPIDRVRCLTNIFTGRTGAAIAVEAHRLGHHITLLTSHPEAVLEVGKRVALTDERWRTWTYLHFHDLDFLMGRALTRDGYDVLIHTAAVSDYLPAGIFAAAEGTSFDPDKQTWIGNPPTVQDRAAAKVKSNEPELWLRLVRAPKLVDKVRHEWNFRGVLVKFKLEVGIDEQRLLAIAEPSRVHSDADLMVANTLEGAQQWALLGPGADGHYARIARAELAERLLAAVERKHKERTHG